MVALAVEIGKGVKYYVPYTPQGFLFFYNKEIFKAAGVSSVPNTWDQFLETCEKIKKAGYIPMTMDDKYAVNIYGYLITRMKGTDWVEKLVYDDTKAMWDDPACLRAAQMVSDCWNKGYFAPNVGSNKLPSGQQEMVIGEKIAMYLNGTWVPNETKDVAKKDFQWGQFPFPEVPGGVDGTEGGAYGSYGIAVNKACDEQTAKAAFSFAVFITTGEWDKTMSVVASAIPMGVDSEWPVSLADAKQALSSYTKRYPAQLAIRMNAATLPIIQSAFIDLMSGKINPAQFLTEVKK
jgi:raffinose/stachyose/melibiose transport system substrate-binding protein